MKTIIVNKAGRLVVSDGAEREEARSGTVVRVKYAGVGFADVMAAKGGYILAPKPPFSPGYEFMGWADSGGQSVRVAGMLTRMGAYRELFAVEDALVVPVPDGVSDETAAALPLNYVTALALLERFARLRRGQSVLIHGAAGGVGVAVLELCRILGFRSFGSCSAPKHGLVESLGSTAVLRSELEASPESIVARYGAFDAVLDPFGGASLERSWKLVAAGGVLVSFGFASTIRGGKTAVASGLASLLVKKINLAGKRTRLCGTPAVVRADPDWYRAAMGRLFAWAKEGKIAPVIHRILPWDQVEEAHRLIEAGEVQGKILLDFAPAIGPDRNGPGS
jgi:NADPH:quinone reductase-like Zn-dependent oxidoreductase